MQNTMLWFGLGSAVVAVLAAYAGYLLYKLYRQHQRHQAFLERTKALQAEKIAQRNATILDSVYIIAEAGVNDQCDMSEISIRLFKLMEALQHDKAVDFAVQYPALYELYQVVKDMPRSEARRNIEKRQRMRLDLDRMKAEARLVDDIKQELNSILAMKS
ncbi:Protein of uncharacterised function (DUF2489) [Photobacterium damselae]|nr:DUF2489 domain-containing protein [Photobacterium damselae]SPY31797.1 Protein of uncharacterised function (DUF2489) [Photobacterium damselae]